MASSHDIKMFHVRSLTEKNGSIDVLATQIQAQTITSSQLKDMKIIGLYFNDEKIIVAFETVDNQIDFNHLKVKGVTGPESKDRRKFNYKLKQVREVVPRSDKFDPIVQLKMAFNEHNQGFTVTLRKSGKVDFYYQMSRIATYETKPNRDDIDLKD